MTSARKPAVGSRELTASLMELSEVAARAAATLGPSNERALSMTRDALAGGGTLFFCGNGGSAADAQHLATEYVVRYMRDRPAMRAIALTTDTSLLTAAGNDLGFDLVFSRQIEALARPGDLVVIHSTSGNSPNVLRAAEAARRLGVKTLAFSKGTGGKLAALVDHCVLVPAERTDRAQELHLCIQHAICDAIESAGPAETAPAAPPKGEKRR